MPAAVLTQHNDAQRTGINNEETRLNWTNVNVNSFGRLCAHAVEGQIYAQPLYVPNVELPSKGRRDLVIVATMANWIYAIDAKDTSGGPGARLWSHHLGDLAPVPTDAFSTDYNDVAGSIDKKIGRRKIKSQIGILSTPVVDARLGGDAGGTTGTIFVVAMQFDPSKFAATPEEAFSHFLFALDLTTGLPLALPDGGQNPVRFVGSVAGAGYGARNQAGRAERVNGRIAYKGTINNSDLTTPRALLVTDGHTAADGMETVQFNAMQQLQRPGLLLSDGVVFTAFGSHGDNDPYHGWVFAHDSATLARKGIFCTTQNGARSGIWQAGEGLAIDAEGNIYAGTGNGDFDGHVGAFGECLLKLRLDGTGFQLAGFSNAFRDEEAKEGLDEDFGASSPTFLPDGRLVGGGKDGNFYLFDPALMDTAGDPTSLIQLFWATADAKSDDRKTHHIHGSPVAYTSRYGVLVYVWGEDDLLRCFVYDDSAHLFKGQPNKRYEPGTPFAIGDTPTSGDVPPKTIKDPAGGMPGGMLSLSANASKLGSAILWASFPPYDDANQKLVGGELRAFKADEFEKGRFVTLWSSRCNAARDDVGDFAKFCCPTVADGRVYQATFSESGGLAVYGLLGRDDGGYDIGFGGKTGLVFNGCAGVLQGGHVQLVADPHIYQAGSIFFHDRVDVRAFGTTFVVELPVSRADGFTFTIQGTSPHALGSSGMGLGYGPNAASQFDRGARITGSVALKFGLIDSATLQPRSSIGLYLDGATPQGPADRDLTIDLHAETRFEIAILYEGGVLESSITDLATGRSDTFSFPVDVPSHAGSDAFVGFTGATGGFTSTQNILSWDFSPILS